MLGLIVFTLLEVLALVLQRRETAERLWMT